jgi:hypothetical protein
MMDKIARYLNPAVESPPNKALQELSATAKAVALEEDDCLVAVDRHHPHHCVHCGESNADIILPQRIKRKTHTLLLMLCHACLPDLTDPEDTEYLARFIGRLDEDGVLETAFLWETEGKLMLFTKGLRIVRIR